MRLLISILFTFCMAALAVEECAWVVGKLQCNKDPSRAVGVELKMYDEDFEAMFNKDDLMGRTISADNGIFQLDGCGSDFDWVVFHNKPDPYVKIFHFCKSERGDTIRIPIRVFAPESEDLGIIKLD